MAHHDFLPSVSDSAQPTYPTYGLIAAGLPPYYCPLCFGQQSVSNMGKPCKKCADNIATKRDQHTKAVEQLKTTYFHL